MPAPPHQALLRRLRNSIIHPRTTQPLPAGCDVAEGVARRRSHRLTHAIVGDLLGFRAMRVSCRSARAARDFGTQRSGGCSPPVSQSARPDVLAELDPIKTLQPASQNRGKPPD